MILNGRESADEETAGRISLIKNVVKLQGAYE
jgi:hypothetical protein